MKKKRPGIEEDPEEAGVTLHRVFAGVPGEPETADQVQRIAKNNVSIINNKIIKKRAQNQKRERKDETNQDKFSVHGNNFRV
ncbi:MAG: hypothetical protein ABIN58_13680 [candidate division WOR-3 bacterium]